MDGAALVAVDGAGCRVLDSLDIRQLSGLLVILNAVYLSGPDVVLKGFFVIPFADFEVQRAPQSVVKVGEELSLKHAVEKRVRFLSTDHQGEPIILQV